MISIPKPGQSPPARRVRWQDLEWRGRPVGDLTRDELLECIEAAYHNERWTRYMSYLQLRRFASRSAYSEIEMDEAEHRYQLQSEQGTES